MEAGSKRDEIDERMRSELEKYLDDLPMEGKEEGWLRIHEEVYSPRRRAAACMSRRLLATAAILAVAILILLQTPPVRAWGRDFLSSQLVKLPGPLRNIVTVFIPLDPQDSPGLADPEKQMRTLFSSISFKPLVIGKEAGGWSLESVGVETRETGTRVTLEYEGEHGTVFALEEDPVHGPRSSATFYDADDTVVTDVTIRGNQISILSHKSGQVNVWWIEQGLALYLNGQAEADTAVDFISRLVVYAGGR